MHLIIKVRSFLVACLASVTLILCSVATIAADNTSDKVLNADKTKKVVSSQFDSFVGDLKTLTNIDSGTGNLEGNAQVATFLKQRITELGGTTEFKESVKGKHVIGRFKGNGTLRILLAVHTDTVFEKGEAAKRPFSVDKNNFAHGPGAGDDKAAVAETLQLIQAFNTLGVKNYGEIIAYFDAEEEMKSDFEEETLRGLARQADVAIILDTSPANWGITTQRKGRMVYEMKVTGTGGHAGASPHASASAIMELGHQLTMLYKLASPLPHNPQDYTSAALKKKGIIDHGQFIPKNSINVGVIGTTNTKVNVVPDNAFARFEVRGYTMPELNRLDAAIRALARQTIVPGTKVVIEGKMTKPPMEKTPQIEHLVNMYKKIVFRTYKVKVLDCKDGGATVGNITATVIPTLDSLGIEAADEHTDHEFADLNTFVPRTVTLILFLDEMSRTFKKGEMSLKK